MFQDRLKNVQYKVYKQHFAKIINLFSVLAPGKPAARPDGGHGVPLEAGRPRRTPVPQPIPQQQRQVGHRLRPQGHLHDRQGRDPRVLQEGERQNEGGLRMHRDQFLLFPV